MRSTSQALPTLRSLKGDRRTLARVQWQLLVSALLLSAVGWITVRSAGAQMSTDYASRQALWIGVGLLVFLVAGAFDYRRLSTLSPLIYGATIVLLGGVLIFGRTGGGARSWIGTRALGFQPSELAKIATVLILARVLGEVGERYITLKNLVKVSLIVGLPMVLLALQPDLGGAAMFVPMVLAMVLVVGVRLRWVVTVFLVGLLVSGVFWTVGMKPYQRQRVKTFLAPGSDPLGAGYQVRQSKIAVGSGGVSGKGYLEGTQSRLRFLPARHTDFIFAVLAEEWGFVGVAAVFGLYYWYLQSLAVIALRARDRTGILVVVGFWAFFAFHLIYNSAMVVGLVPITGIPLPFLSYGGSYTLFNYAATGLILGVDYRRYVNR